jgi:hypothetical protein
LALQKGVNTHIRLYVV